MKYQLVITIALAAAFTTGCDLELEENLGDGERPEVEHPIDRDSRDPMEGDVERPIGEVEPPIGAPEDGEDGIEHPIEEVEPPIDAPEDGGDAPEVFDVNDPDGGDSGVGGSGSSGAFGDSEEDADAEDEGEWIFGEACEPGADACQDGATCEETCESSYCDEDGHCTRDCRIVFRCAEFIQ